MPAKFSDLTFRVFRMQQNCDILALNFSLGVISSIKIENAKLCLLINKMHKKLHYCVTFARNFPFRNFFRRNDPLRHQHNKL